MFDRSSRYLGIPLATYTSADGRAILYVRRRMIPQSDSMTMAGSYVVRAGERLDTIAAAVYNDATQFWRICDANDELYPFDLLRPRRRLNVPRVTAPSVRTPIV